MTVAQCRRIKRSPFFPTNRFFRTGEIEDPDDPDNPIPQLEVNPDERQFTFFENLSTNTPFMPQPIPHSTRTEKPLGGEIKYQIDHRDIDDEDLIVHDSFNGHCFLF